MVRCFFVFLLVLVHRGSSDPPILGPGGMHFPGTEDPPILGHGGMHFPGTDDPPILGPGGMQFPGSDDPPILGPGGMHFPGSDEPSILGPGGMHFPGSTTDSPSCSTFERMIRLDNISLRLIQEVNGSGLIMINFTTMETKIPEGNLPFLFEFLCDTSGTESARRGLLMELHDCPTLDLRNPFLMATNINGVSLAELFMSMGGFNSFCDCRYRLLNAWSFKDRWKEHTLLDVEKRLTFVVAHIGNICGKTLRGLIDSIENAPSQCRSGLEKQAGFPNSRGKLFSGYLDIVRTCESSADTEADWACIKEVALSTSFNKCILREEKAHGRNGTIPMCRRYKCVSSEMHDCGATAIELYVKAANLELYQDEIDRQLGFKESYDGCEVVGGAIGLCFSGMLLAVVIAVFMML